MKNPFRFFKSSDKPQGSPAPIPSQPEEIAPPDQPEEQPAQPPASLPEEQPDGFTEWCRTRVQGGIERRERNDIYEEYSVYGADGESRLICRYYHRYPEHERDFDLSYSRALSFSEFNRRLLAELDKGSIPLTEYNACVTRAEQLLSLPPAAAPAFEGFTDADAAALRDFCESLDTLKDKEYRGGEGLFRCACSSVVGDEALSLWFRKPLPRDALAEELPGVEKTAIATYDIDNIWMMGVCNRLIERCGACTVTRLTSRWSLGNETVLLMEAKRFPGVEGAVLLAVADPAAMARFGFYALDFSRK